MYGAKYEGTDPIKDAKKAHKKETIMTQKNEEIEGVDPFQRYGAGITIFFKQLEGLMMSMFLFSILVIPVIYLYYNYGTQYRNTTSFYAEVQSLSLGNLGEAQNFIIRDFVPQDNKSKEVIAYLKCDSGRIRYANIYGLIPWLKWPPQWAGSVVISPLLRKCQKTIDPKIADDFVAQCNNKTSCKFKLISYVNLNSNLTDECLLKQRMTNIYLQYKCDLGGKV